MSKKGGDPELGQSKTHKKPKKVVVVIVIILLLALGGGAWWLAQYFFTDGSEGSSLGGLLGGANTPEPIYSAMTGLEIPNAQLNNSPVYCMQIPNGSTDGARPQVGLTSAAVVFEAIAETGITRFAAIFQNAEDTMIGPIRSLRPYYLEWDTPFDCTIVHDGGSDEALAAVSRGYRNLDENFNYMWKESYINGQYRYWNNVFTSSSLLNNFNNDNGYTTSSPKTFPRLKPADVEAVLASQEPTCEDDVCAEQQLIETISYSFTNIPDYQVIFHYDRETNSYLRANNSYSGEIAHESYSCPNAATEPPAGCELSPSCASEKAPWPTDTTKASQPPASAKPSSSKTAKPSKAPGQNAPSATKSSSKTPRATKSPSRPDSSGSPPYPNSAASAGSRKSTGLSI